MGQGAFEKLKNEALAVPTPKNYFRGRSPGRILLADNLLVFARTTCAALQKKTFELRPHHRFVLVMALECEGVVSIDGRTFPLPEMHGLLIFPYQFHQFLEIQREDILWLIITFEFPDPEAFSEFRDQIFKLTPDLQKMLVDILSLYNRKPEPDGDADLLLRSTLFLHSLRDALRSGQQLPEEEPLVEEGKGRILLSKIERELTSPSRVSYPRAAELAEKVGYSESRLRAVFKQHVGVSLGSYLRNYQIHRAIALMRNPELTLSDVAAEAGFNSTTSFCRAFKAHTQATPREYRNHLRKLHSGDEHDGDGWADPQEEDGVKDWNGDDEDSK